MELIVAAAKAGVAIRDGFLFPGRTVLAVTSWRVVITEKGSSLTFIWHLLILILQALEA